MPDSKGKHHIFSARITEAGLKALNELKAKLDVSWDELVISAMSAYYSLDKGMLALPKPEKPKVEAPKAGKPRKAEAKAETKAKGKSKRAKPKPKPKRVVSIEAEAIKV